MGALYFFSEPLPAAYLRGIYRLGAGYCETFTRPTDSSHNSDNDGNNYGNSNSMMVEEEEDIALVFDGTLHPLLMLVVNPSIFKGKLLVNMAPESNATIWGGDNISETKGQDSSRPWGAYAGQSDIAFSSSFSSSNSSFHSSFCSRIENQGLQPNQTNNAIMLHNTLCNCTYDIRDALDCLGGVKVVLPLFLQLGSRGNFDDNNPTDKYKGSVGTTSIVSGDPQYPHHRISKVFDIFFSLLRLTPANNSLLGSGYSPYLNYNKIGAQGSHSHAFRMDQGCDGFQLIASVLARLQPSHLNVHVLDNLISHCEDLGEQVRILHSHPA